MIFRNKCFVVHQQYLIDSKNFSTRFERNGFTFNNAALYDKDRVRGLYLNQGLNETQVNIIDDFISIPYPQRSSDEAVDRIIKIANFIDQESKDIVLKEINCEMHAVLVEVGIGKYMERDYLAGLMRNTEFPFPWSLQVKKNKRMKNLMDSRDVTAGCVTIGEMFKEGRDYYDYLRLAFRAQCRERRKMVESQLIPTAISPAYKRPVIPFSSPFIVPALIKEISIPSKCRNCISPGVPVSAAQVARIEYTYARALQLHYKSSIVSCLSVFLWQNRDKQRLDEHWLMEIVASGRFYDDNMVELAKEGVESAIPFLTHTADGKNLEVNVGRIALTNTLCGLVYDQWTKPICFHKATPIKIDLSKGNHTGFHPLNTMERDAYNMYPILNITPPLVMNFIAESVNKGLLVGPEWDSRAKVEATRNG